MNHRLSLPVKIKSVLSFVAVCGLLISISACKYSFVGTSIDYNTLKTYSVKTFDVTAPGAPATVGTVFTEKLKDKIRSGTRLRYEISGGDVAFTGQVTGFTIVAIAPKPGETTALQQLTVSINVNADYSKNSDKSWSQSFSYPVTYSSGQDFNAIQDQLLNEAMTNILDNIFNKAFGDW